MLKSKKDDCFKGIRVTKPNHDNEPSSKPKAQGATTQHDQKSSWSEFSKSIYQDHETASSSWLWLKENAAGFIGVAAIVLGIIFAGTYVGLFASAFIRFLMIVLVGCGFIGLSMVLRMSESWKELGEWLQAGAGAIFLLAFLGGDYFESLRFYDSPSTGFIVAVIGLSINFGLACLKPKESLGIAHVLLSLVALSAVPMQATILWAGAILCVFMLLLSYRNQWRIHCLATLISFTILNHVWYFSGETLNLWHGTCAALLVFIPGFITHYSQIYKDTDKDALKSTRAHILALGLFIYNLCFLQQDITWISIPFGVAAIVTLGMALMAKRRAITSLFFIDLVASQLLIAMACIALRQYGVAFYDITWLLATEMLLFLFLSIRYQWFNLISIHILLSGIALFVFLSQVIIIDFDQSFLLITSSLALVYAGFHLVYPYTIKQKHESLCAGFVNVSLFVLFTTLLYLSIHHETIKLNFWFATIFTGGLLCNKRLMANSIHRGTIFALVGTTILASWWTITFEIAQQNISPEAILWEACYMAFIPISILLALMLKGKALHSKTLKHWNLDYLIYLFGLQILFMMTLMHPIHMMLPGAFALVTSITLLGLRSYMRGLKESDKISVAHVAVNNLGLSGLIAFLVCFIFNIESIHTQMFGIISIQGLMSMLGIIVCLLWMQAKPIQSSHHRSIWSPTIGFDIAVILAVALIILYVKSPMVGLGLCALGTALMTWPKLNILVPTRKDLYCYSLLACSLLHATVNSSHLALTPSTWYENPQYTSLMAITLCCLLATLLNTHQDKDNHLDNNLAIQNKSHPFFDKPLLNYLPIFMSLGLFLLWQFSDTVLTTLWVIETFAMVLLGIYLRRQAFIHIAYIFLMICLAKLLFYDFAQATLILRALVLIIVGILLLAIHVSYKTLKGRFK